MSEKTLHDEVMAAYESSVEGNDVEISQESEEPLSSSRDNLEAQENNTPQEAEEDVQAPEHWASEDKDVFKALDKKGRDFLVRRHKEMEASHTKKLQALSEESKIAENFRKTMTPHEAYLRQLNIDPLQAVDHLIKTEMRLRMSSPKEKAALIHDLARQYGAQFDPDYQPEEIDERTQIILNELNKTQERVNRIENERRNQEISGYENQINSFASEKDERGNAKHPHFETIRKDMGILINAGKASSLAEAYEGAILLNAELRKEYFDKKYGNPRHEEDAKQKLAASKKAGFNVRSSSGAQISDPKQTLSLRETIAQALKSQQEKQRV